MSDADLSPSDNHELLDLAHRWLLSSGPDVDSVKRYACVTLDDDSTQYFLLECSHISKEKFEEIHDKGREAT